MSIKVNEASSAVMAMRPDLAKIAALMGGTKAMRAAGETHLPRWPAEKQDSYDFRLKTSTLYNAFARTIGNMAGKPFTEPVKWTDIDPVIEAWFDDIDCCGRNLHVFAQEVFCQGIQDGITHVLVEFPVTKDKDGKQLYVTRAAEQAAGVRPYAIHIKEAQILGAIPTTKNGAESLAQLRIMECVSEPDGDYGTKDVEQVRVLTPGAWQIQRQNDKKEWYLHDEGVTTLDFIPLVTFYTRRTGFMTATPPLNDLADLNIKHWQSQSDQDSLLHVARVPLLVRIGMDDDPGAPTKIGKSITDLPMNADMKYVEHTGAAIGAGRSSLQDLEDQMESMGAELLTVRPGDRTATEAAIDTSQSQCQLAAMANALEDFLDQMVDIMAEWAGLPDQGDIDVFDDFATISINAATVGPFVTAMVLQVNSGLLSKQSAFEEMKRYGVNNPDLTWEAEQERINSSMPTLTGFNQSVAPAAEQVA